MPNKNTTLSLHAAVAHEIKSAKRAMFKRHREGQSLANSANTFLWEMQNRLHRVLVETGQQPAKRPAVTIPIEGTVGDDGIKLFGDVVDNAKLVEERARVQGEVHTILTLFESPTPDFISSVVIDAIAGACEHFGIDEPEYELGDEGKSQTRNALTQLFAKTRNFTFPREDAGEDKDHVDATLENGEEVELYGDAVDIASAYKKSDFHKMLEAVHELLHNPKTPGGLFESVAGFITDQSNEVNEIFHEPTVLATVLSSVKPEDLMGAIEARRAQEANHTTN
jgi:hypothetical protein